MKILVLLMVAVALAACNPFKVTDPQNPKFDAAKFRFEDYKTSEIKHVLMQIFPIGTPQIKIDDFFLQMLHNSKNLYDGHMT